MSCDVFHSSTPVNAPQSKDLELDWKQAVWKRLELNEPLRVLVSDINDVIDRDDIDVKIGSELVLENVSIDKARITLKENFENPDKIDKEGIVVPANASGKYEPCPHYSLTHEFGSVKELMAVYPFISNMILPQEAFTVEGVDVPAWEALQIVNMVQESSSEESLEVKIVKRNRHVLLPSNLQVKFVQLNTNRSLEDAAFFNQQDSRVFALQELCGFWSPKLHPMTVTTTDSRWEHPKSDHVAVKSPTRKLFQFRKKKDKAKTAETSPKKSNEDCWMIPETWRTKKLVIEPIHTVTVSQNKSEKATFHSDIKLKVIIPDPNDQKSVDRPKSLELDKSDQSGRIRTSSENSTPLQQLDIMSLFNVRERKSAIVAMVTSSLTTGSRQPSSLAYGTVIALHRTRKVRKMLFKSHDAQYFLVSAHYSGEFKRLPLIFDSAADVPIDDDDVPYVTRCTAYPASKQLDSCQEGQYVWFKQRSEAVVNNVIMKVVMCLVSNSIDGERQEVTYPLNLRGRFERIDEDPSTPINTQRLFRKKLPICVKVEKPDPSIGFDPLIKKQSFHVLKKVSEMSVVIERLKKVEDIVKGSGKLIEIPVSRCSLYVREIPSKSEDSVHGIEPYLLRKDFKGLQKLPCVEMLAECDVSELREARNLMSTSSSFSLSIEKDTDQLTSDTRADSTSWLSPEKPKESLKHDFSVNKTKLSGRRSKSTDNLFAAIQENGKTETEIKNQPSNNYKHVNNISTDSVNHKPKPKPRTKTFSVPEFSSNDLEKANSNVGEVHSNSEKSQHNGIAARELKSEPLNASKKTSTFPAYTEVKLELKSKREAKRIIQRGCDDYEEVALSDNERDYDDVAEELGVPPTTPPRPKLLG